MSRGGHERTTAETGTSWRGRRTREAVASGLLGGSIFIATAALVFRYLAQYGKSNVWATDGLMQHFPALYYFNVWVRGFLAHPSAGVPLWSWNLGLGGDIIGTLAFYVVGDPFALLSLAFPMARMETAYLVMFLARVACAGLFSWLYFRKMGGRPMPSVIGAIVYTFTTFTLTAGMHHPYFLNGLVFLPLLLWGVEDLLRERRPYALIGATCLAAASNFYFFYMQALITVLYAVVRGLELSRGTGAQRSRRLLGMAAAFAGSFLVGMMLAAPVLLPALRAFFDSSRGGVHKAVGLLYPLRTYASMVAAASLPYAGRPSTYLGFSPVAFSLLGPFLLRRGNTAVKWMTGLIALFIALPFFGSLFNGFAFPSNRFAFTWGIFLALAVVLVLSDPAPLTRRELAFSAAIIGLYALAIAGMRLAGGAAHSARHLVPLGIATAVWLALFAESRRGAPRTPTRGPSASRLRTGWSESVTRWCVLGVVILGVAGNAALSFDRRFTPVLDEWVAFGTALPRYAEQTAGLLAASIDDPAFYRVDKQRYVYGPSNAPAKANDALIQGYRGTAMEYSVANGRILELMKEMESRCVWLSFGYTGFDDSAVLSAIVGQKYLVAMPGLDAFVPFGFSSSTASDTIAVRSNALALPLGFVYDAAIPRSAYEPLGVLDKQAAFLQGAVIDDSATASLATIAPVPRAKELPYSIAETDGVRVDLAGRKLLADRAGGSVTLRFAPATDSELAVELSRPRWAAVKGHPLGEAIRLRYQVAGDPVAKTAGRMLPVSNYYWPCDSLLVNLGYRPSGAREVKITFVKPVRVWFDALRVIALPMYDVPGRVGHLKVNALHDIDVGTNRISGSVETTAGGVLFLSVPYSTGWRATVDGSPAPVIRANTAFLGVVVPGGRHRVELRYMTPWLPEGLAAFGLGLGAVGVMATARMRRRRRDMRSRPGLFREERRDEPLG